MHLKRVELENFKSFGRKLTVPFLEGFTAITGPNGSGKSNIGDAILFVLGPRSNKAIRAGRLTDLIFNGGKEKKPSDHCKVSLVFDNKDRVIPVENDEVTLTRLVKLSKNSPENYYSYFYVNGKPSSLGEFATLLEHSRISADGYNIVRQGDVLRIVEMTPLERRRIVDEIAGIAKFDADIEKCMKEKGEIEQNLDRINIILDEINRQLQTLEREREAALKYKEIKEKLDVAKATLAKKRHDNHVDELAGVRRQIEAQDAERARLEEVHETLKAEIADADRAIEAIDEKIKERGGPEAEELKRKLDALKAEVVRATERMNYAKQEIAGLKEDRHEVVADLKRVEKEQEKHAKERDGVLAKKAEADEKLAARQKDLKDLRDQMAQGQGRAGELTRELAQMKVDFERAEGDAHKAELERDRLADKVERLREVIGETEEHIETQTFEIKDVDFELREIEKEAQSKGGDLDTLQKNLFQKKKLESEVSRELRELEPAIRRLQNDYARLKAEQDASEAASRGYTRAVDAVITARDQGLLKGIHGTIAELANVDEKYANAMETAAGGRMQAIVTESDADAAAAIQYLKDNRVGRATFLPLNKMVPGRPAGKPLMAVRDPGAEGFAIDLISFDERYKAAFWYVFRDTVIVRDMGTARKLMGGTRLVTLDGDIVDAAGAMTGGDQGRRRGQVGFGQSQRDQLERISKELRAANGHQEGLTAQLVQVREEVEALEARIREARSESGSAGDRVGQLKKRRAEAEARLKDLKQDLANREQELADAMQAHEKVDARVTDLRADLDRMASEREEKGKLLLAATNKETARQLSELEAEVADLREVTRDFASDVATLEKNLELLNERKTEISDDIARIDREAEAHAKTRDEAKAFVAEKEKELNVLAEVEAQQSEELRGLHDERNAAVEARSDLRTRAGKLADRIDTTGDQIAALKARIPALESTISELAEELTQYEGVEIPAEIPETVEALRGRARALENQLDALGNVNMLALEEYDRQLARKSEHEGSIEQLTVERERLLEVVTNITETKKTEFYKVFNEINENFASVFGRLSDGGKAELMLEDAEQPFNGGLILRAQPKGKKVTRLEALSGGEKSLTSMAFIFAIQEFDPSPFYYLDEVDQNLDGINSELLAKLVKNNSKHAQFIVVSLRKVTLKEADHVYGVTMLDTGLSEVVGEVRISEIMEEPSRPVKVDTAAESAVHASEVQR